MPSLYMISLGDVEGMSAARSRLTDITNNFLPSLRATVNHGKSSVGLHPSAPFDRVFLLV